MINYFKNLILHYWDMLTVSVELLVSNYKGVSK